MRPFKTTVLPKDTFEEQTSSLGHTHKYPRGEEDNKHRGLCNHSQTSNFI